MFRKVHWILFVTFFLGLFFFSCSNEPILSDKKTLIDWNPSSPFGASIFLQGNWKARLKTDHISNPSIWQGDDHTRMPIVMRAQNNNVLIRDTGGAYDSSNESDEWKNIKTYLDVFRLNSDLNFFVSIDVNREGTVEKDITDQISALESFTSSSALGGIVLHEFHTKWCSPLALEDGTTCLSPTSMSNVKSAATIGMFQPKLYVYTDAKYLGQSIMPGYLLGAKSSSDRWTQMNSSSATGYTDPDNTTSYVSLTFTVNLSSLNLLSTYDFSFLFSDNLEKYFGQEQDRDARILVYVNGNYLTNSTGHNTSIYRTSSTDKDDYIRIYSGNTRPYLTAGDNTIEVRLACTSTSSNPLCSSYDIHDAQVTLWDLKFTKKSLLSTTTTSISLGTATMKKVHNGSETTSSNMFVRDNSATLVASSLDGVMFIFGDSEVKNEWSGVHERVSSSLNDYLKSISPFVFNRKTSSEVFRHYTATGSTFSSPIVNDFDQQKRFLEQAKLYSDGVILWQFPFALYDKFADSVTTPTGFPFSVSYYSSTSQDKGIFSKKDIGLFITKDEYVDYSAMVYYPRNSENNIPGWYQQFKTKTTSSGIYTYELTTPHRLKDYIANGSVSDRFQWQLSFRTTAGTETIIETGSSYEGEVFSGSYDTAGKTGDFYFKLTQTGTSGSGQCAYFALLKVSDSSGNPLVPADWIYSSGVSDENVKGQSQCFNAFFANVFNWKSYCVAVP